MWPVSFCTRVLTLLVQGGAGGGMFVLGIGALCVFPTSSLPARAPDALEYRYVFSLLTKIKSNLEY